MSEIFRKHGGLMKNPLNKLTKKQLIHILDSIDWENKFDRTIELQAKWRADSSNTEPCWECKKIAEVLNKL